VVKRVGFTGYIRCALPLLPAFLGYKDVAEGDIVVARDPTCPRQLICKRVRGVEGDRIPLEYRVARRFVPEGAVWVEGDNSLNSRDSRHYGPLPLGLIRGVVVKII